MLLTVLLDVNPSLGRVEPEEAGGVTGRVAHHKRDGGVQRHRVPQLVLEHVQVIEAVGVRAARVLQAEGVSMLRDPVHMLHTYNNHH